MPSVHETAYPRIRSEVTEQDLSDVFTPTVYEIALAKNVAKGDASKICFLVMLKTFQRLGYFVQLREVPEIVVGHVAKSLGRLFSDFDLAAYDQSGTRRRHVVAIRKHMQVLPFSQGGSTLLAQAARDAAKTKEDLADIINVAIEELVRNRHELPGFRTLHDEAQRSRAEANSTIYAQITGRLQPEHRTAFDAILKSDEGGKSFAVAKSQGRPWESHSQQLSPTR